MLCCILDKEQAWSIKSVLPNFWGSWISLYSHEAIVLLVRLPVVSQTCKMKESNILMQKSIYLSMTGACQMLMVSSSQDVFAEIMKSWLMMSMDQTARDPKVH